MLLVPAAAQFVEAVHPVVARLVVGREAAAVRPRRVAGRLHLDGDDAVGGAREQLAVVAHEQHGLLGRAQGILEPALAGHVEVVVRLVEQQHLLRTAQQRLEHEPLLLAARERVDLAVLRTLERDAERGDRAGVPHGLLVVAAGIRVLRERGRVGQLVHRRVVLDERELGAVDGVRGIPNRFGSDRDQQVAHGRGVAAVPTGGTVSDELVHDAEAAVDRDRALVGLEAAVLLRPAGRTADDPQQRRLAGTVRADERRRRALADAERHLVEQRPPVGERVRHPVDVDEPHDRAPCLEEWMPPDGQPTSLRDAAPERTVTPRRPNVGGRSVGCLARGFDTRPAARPATQPPNWRGSSRVVGSDGWSRVWRASMGGDQPPNPQPPRNSTAVVRRLNHHLDVVRVRSP